MKKFLSIILAALSLSILASSCVKNSELEGKVKDIVQLDSLNARMAALEAQMKLINGDITSLKAIVAALQKNLYVTNVEQSSEGFSLTFSDGSSVSVKNGTNGKDGAAGKDAPVVGVKDTVGAYFWVLVDKTKTPADTSWILDDKGKMIPVTGEKGDTGATGPQGETGDTGPQGPAGKEVGVKDTLSVLYWVLIDKSKSPADSTWLTDNDGNKIKAEGKDGDSMFSGVDTTQTGYVILTLATGTELKLPYKAELDKLVARIQSIEVVPEYTDGSVVIKKNGTVTISFEVRPVSLLDSIFVASAEFSLQAVKTEALTKAVTYYDLEVTDPTVGTDDSLLTLTVAKGELPDEFFAGTKHFNARLHISDGNTDKSSAYFPLNPIQETANCYIVSTAGTYKFKAVKGNSDESVGDVKSVKVLWESFGTSSAPSAGEIISSVSYSSGVITYTATDKKGNAVIAAYSEASGTGNILWSWHIWCTDKPEEQVYTNTAGTMMDRNLGATSATKGDVGALGLLYQWGRKDPFLSSSAKNANTRAASTPDTWTTVAVGSTGAGTNNLSYSISHPTTYITNTGNTLDWYCTSVLNKNDSLWKVPSGKTIYDPCPAGWRVPDGGNSGVWKKAGFSTTTKSGAFDCGYDFAVVDPGGNTWYPAAGDYYPDGTLSEVGTHGYCWSCTPDSNREAYHLWFSNSGTIASAASWGRVNGCSVRCVKE